MISILDILCWFDLVKDCGVLSTPTNGAQTSDGSVVGSSTSFSCDTGYKLEGASTRLCRIDGTWSRTDTSCVRKLLFYIINILNTALARTNHGMICWTSTMTSPIIPRISLLRLSLLRLSLLRLSLLRLSLLRRLLFRLSLLRLSLLRLSLLRLSLLRLSLLWLP